MTQSQVPSTALPAAAGPAGWTAGRIATLVAGALLVLVEIRGMEVVQVRQGKIVPDALYYDNLASMAQLGLLPEGAIA